MEMTMKMEMPNNSILLRNNNRGIKTKIIK